MAQLRRSVFVAGLVAVLTSLATAQGAPLRLTLEEAIQRGLRHNLGPLLAESRIQEAQGTLERRKAALLPRARFDAPVTIQNRNLRAQGISIPGMPDVVGPFTTYDFRVGAEQSVIDFQSLHAKRAAAKQVEASRTDYQAVRNDIIRQIASLYLSAQSAAAEVTAAESRVTTAAALYHLAADQRGAGVATGIDVTRADVRLSRERQTLVQARNAARNSLFVLARNLGLRPSTEIELAEMLQAASIPTPDVEQAVTAAAEKRPDYQTLARQRESVTEQIKASRSRYLPKFGLSANYGGLGRTFGQIKGTGQAQASLQFTVFDRDREGERLELEARASRVEKQMADLRLGIEQEIRQAVLNLDSAEDEVAVAREGLALAEKELELARVRFGSGVTNNIEVINAQDSLARAQENSILALTRHADARIALAHALGDTEQNYRQYLGGR